ncbi:esterase/lipase family protein [Nocardioides sp. Bht2]|uniref:esterase/lipase family protein n=1 Tax=Nocardioides sp. Bht2 TaxID=3392297 RepID=UPI0039B42C6E
MRRIAVTLLTLLALLLGLTSSPAVAEEKLPVPWSFLPTAVTGGASLSFSAPGTNDWSCKPSKAHPRPVVLVHGTFGNGNTNWQTYGPLLKNAGYCVYALTYGQLSKALPLSILGGFGSMKASARQLKRFVAKVRRHTGAAKVDLVGHSQGTLMPQYWVRYLGGRKHVRNYVSLAPLWHGTQVADVTALLNPVFGGEDSFPACTACAQFGTGSAFMKKIRKGKVASKGIRYTNIMTRYDELVIPYSSGRQKGMRNLVVQDYCATDFSEHFEIAADPIAARLVLNTLDPKRAKKVGCTVVLPFIGPLGANAE